MKLLLIRHGETELNRTNHVCGCTDPPLNRNGIIQARKSARLLRNEKIGLVYCSPKHRARQTAAILFKHRKHILKPELREVDFGKWEGLYLKEIEAKYPKRYQKWLRHPEQGQFPKGESIRSLKKRVMKFINNLIKQYAVPRPVGGNRNKTIAIVTHGIPIKIMVCELLRLGFKGFWWFHPAFASVTCLEIYGKQVTLINKTMS